MELYHQTRGVVRYTLGLQPASYPLVTVMGLNLTHARFVVTIISYAQFLKFYLIFIFTFLKMISSLNSLYSPVPTIFHAFPF